MHKVGKQAEYHQNSPPESFRETNWSSNPSLFVWGALNTVVGLQLGLAQEIDMFQNSESHKQSRHMNRLQYLREEQIRASLPLEYMCFRVKGLVEPQSLFTWKVFVSLPLTLTQCR